MASIFQDQVSVIASWPARTSVWGGALAFYVLNLLFPFAIWAAGLAFAGMHPVVAIYATFLNRAFDQLLMDCAMHKAGVTFVLDRSGVTGPDGASHHGMWDMSLASIVPGLRLAAPRDGQQIRVALREAVDVEDGPTVIRFPKGSVADPLEAVATVGGLDVLAGDPAVDPEVLVVSVGSMAGTATTVAEKLAAEGHSTLVVDPRWVLPVPAALVELAGRSGRVAVIEDNNVSGGVGAEVARVLDEAEVTAPVHRFGLPKEFLAHASRAQVLESVGLTPEPIVERLRAHL
mgnify:CR=1 FL=1